MTKALHPARVVLAQATLTTENGLRMTHSTEQTVLSPALASKPGHIRFYEPRASSGKAEATEGC